MAPLFDYQDEPVRDIFMIDVQSFFASVECLERGLDPLTTLLVVMSIDDRSPAGLVLAASPRAKKELGIRNVMRAYELPNDPRLRRVAPRMSLYLERNQRLNSLFHEFVAPEDLHIYSIDESILDVTKSMHLFVPADGQSRSQRRRTFALLIQKTIQERLGLPVTIGIGDNPLLAKLALDNEAKKTRIAEWRYRDVAQKVWKIPALTDFWGIGSRNAKRLKLLGIRSIDDLAHADPAILHQKMGIIGLQLFHHAHGIDRTILAESPPKKMDKSYSNSQILPRDYTVPAEIELVIKEMADQVATRLRQHHCQTECIHLAIGCSYYDPQPGFAHQLKIPITNSSRKLSSYCLQLFHEFYTGQTVRQIGISASRIVYHENRQLDLFEEAEDSLEEQRLEQLIDTIRQRYGYASLVHATALLPGSRSIIRSRLVGGHAGGAGGLAGFSQPQKPAH